MQQDYKARWDKITSSLAQWRRFHRDYAPQIVIWQKHFNKLRLDCEKHLCEYRNTRRSSHVEKAEKLLLQAEAEFKQVSRLEFLASIAK